MRTPYRIAFAVVGATIVLGAGALALLWPLGQEAERKAGLPSSAGPGKLSGDRAQGPVASDAHVRLKAGWRSPSEKGAVTAVARLEIDEGWHVNANPASRDFLIPTRVTLHRGNRTLDVRPRYPSGKSLEVPLIGGDPIQVYEGAVHVLIPLSEAPTGTGDLITRARVQACNEDGRCLPPATLSQPLPPPGAGGGE